MGVTAPARATAIAHAVLGLDSIENLAGLTELLADPVAATPE